MPIDLAEAPNGNRIERRLIRAFSIKSGARDTNDPIELEP